jgi:hypothetical protein
MDSQRARTDSTDDHRAIRQALMRLEQAWNAQDAALLNTLFISAPALINARGERNGVGLLLALLGGQTDAPAYCAISMQHIVPLAEALVYAAFSVQIHRHTDETLSGSNHVCAAVLARDAISGAWRIRLLHFV